MAQFYVTGPVSIWIRYQGEGVVFLGHGERAPSVEFEPYTNPVVCDVGGTAPMEHIYAGEGARISCDLNRVNMSVLNKIRNRAKSILFPNAIAGYDEPGQLGTLMMTEGCAYTVYMRFDGAKRPTMQQAGNALGLGYRFFNCFLEPDSAQGGSAQVYKHHVAWRVLRKFDPTVSNAFGFGGFTLYDRDMSDVDGLPLN